MDSYFNVLPVIVIEYHINATAQKCPNCIVSNVDIWSPPNIELYAYMKYSNKCFIIKRNSL